VEELADVELIVDRASERVLLLVPSEGRSPSVPLIPPAVLPALAPPPPPPEVYRVVVGPIGRLGFGEPAGPSSGVAGPDAARGGAGNGIMSEATAGVREPVLPDGLSVDMLGDERHTAAAAGGEGMRSGGGGDAGGSTTGVGGVEGAEPGVSGVRSKRAGSRVAVGPPEGCMPTALRDNPSKLGTGLGCCGGPCDCTYAEVAAVAYGAGLDERWSNCNRGGDGSDGRRPKPPPPPALPPLALPPTHSGRPVVVAPLLGLIPGAACRAAVATASRAGPIEQRSCDGGGADKTSPPPLSGFKPLACPRGGGTAKGGAMTVGGAGACGEMGARTKVCMEPPGKPPLLLVLLPDGEMGG